MIASVRLIRCFDGLRHRRLRRIWEAIAEAVPDLDIQWYSNQDCRLRHAECYQEIWNHERDQPGRYLLLTEEDFLPALDRPAPAWTGVLDLQHGLPGRGRNRLVGAVGPTYVTRQPWDNELVHHDGLMGGWFVTIDKTRAPRCLTFEGEPDPCNQLPKQLRCCLENGEDCYPEHYGVRYTWGTHLFWSRHLHDDPNLEVAGFHLGSVQEAHDRAVDAWTAKHTRKVKL